MTSTPQLSEELSAGPAKLRIDVDGAERLDHVLDDMGFLNYRLADVRISPEVSLDEPDIIWHRDADKGIGYDGRTMTLSRGRRWLGHGIQERRPQTFLQPHARRRRRP